MDAAARITQAAMKLATKLRRQFPEEDGRHAIVVSVPRQPTFDEGFQGDPTADNRPDFVKQDETGWQRISVSNDKR
jgi:uncharacterized protein (UPF0303 family)